MRRSFVAGMHANPPASRLSSFPSTQDLAPQLDPPLPSDARSSGRSIPTECLLTVLGGFFLTAGIIWDISWHSTIGRDTFWTPAHMMVHLGGLLGGFACAWLVIKYSFLTPRSTPVPALTIWGLRAPLGAWLTLWGALAMLTSAPFDNWWHDAYGLDVKILSPPHALLALGMYHVVMGANFMVASWQNRLPASEQGRGIWFLYLAGGIQLALSAIILTEFSVPNLQHQSSFYKAAALLYPIFLVAASRIPNSRWPATAITSIYLLFNCIMIWLLPLFPAEPKLAPIYNPVTHMVPPAFPLLLFVPAAGIDLMTRWIGRNPGWFRATLSVLGAATVFVSLFTATQWNFSKFLISHSADNAVFAGSRFFPYYSRIGHRKYEFLGDPQERLNPKSFAAAWIFAVGSSIVGLHVGNMMAKVRR